MIFLLYPRSKNLCVNCFFIIIDWTLGMDKNSKQKLSKFCVSERGDTKNEKKYKKKLIKIIEISVGIDKLMIFKKITWDPKIFL